ncbi:hypothetical protein D3880_08500 [Pseudomonas cavernae]|uniref:Poly(3-hydroxyalkanoate) polymerase subunit PhaE n=1 Tax=Pseudomonas cavernae TaxID=2320867 RepID=A0A385Z145_9PSED|nr:hypothetical protein [Pseudomonas cavernae]AYC32414.1 hypothetical protein D3880_08500 [Pseudomonas cavernae]
MATAKFPDPLQFCRDTLTKLESGINQFAARKMESEEFAEALNRFNQVALSVQYTLDKSLACFFERLDLPSRTEVTELAAAVQRVEEKLERLLPDMTHEALLPRPPRTRIPIEIAPAQALNEARTRAKKPKAATPGRRGRKET